MVARPVEFGVANLMPADPIEGVSKGLAGALVVEPKGSSWQTDPGTRMSATVYDWWSDGPDADTNPDRSGFREFVTVLQNNINLRYAACDPAANPQVGELQCAVPSVASLGGGVAEDPQDAGQKAINYGADPLWYRLGIAPEHAVRDGPTARRDTVRRLLEQQGWRRRPADACLRGFAQRLLRRRRRRCSGFAPVPPARGGAGRPCPRHRLRREWPRLAARALHCQQR